MAETLLLKGGRCIVDGKEILADVLIEDGIIKSIAPDIEADVPCFDATGCVICYGLVDVHVHFRVPGFPQKENIKTGSESAAAGGYTIVCPMPNLVPAPDSPETIEQELELIRKDAVVDVIPYATISKGRNGKELVDMKALKNLCVGFSDDGSGVQESDLMLQAMKSAKENDCIIAAHCEDTDALPFSPESEWLQIERDIELCRQTACRYHVCHISTAKSVELIRNAKKDGVNITCETAPHYLLMSSEEIQELVQSAPELGGRFKMNPPVRSSADRDALVEGLLDGTIDMIATDHAPHTAQEKGRGFNDSAMGILGLETAFPVLYTGLVMNGKLRLEALVEAMSTSPRKVFKLEGRFAEGQSADLAVFDLQTKYKIDSSKFKSMGRSTPFEGWEVNGACVMTIFKGKTVYKKSFE